MRTATGNEVIRTPADIETGLYIDLPARLRVRHDPAQLAMYVDSRVVSDDPFPVTPDRWSRQQSNLLNLGT